MAETDRPKEIASDAELKRIEITCRTLIAADEIDVPFTPRLVLSVIARVRELEAWKRGALTEAENIGAHLAISTSLDIQKRTELEARVRELEATALTAGEARWLMEDWPDGAYDTQVIAKLVRIAS